MGVIEEVRSHEPPRRAVGAGFVATYTLAQVGAFISFMPLLNVLLPLKAEAVDPAGKAVLLSQVTLWGALAAAIANLAVGALSDATRGPFGRRRPWIVGGALAVAVGHGLVYAAGDRLGLILAMVVLQVAINVMFAPLNAVLPDVVPGRQKGLVSALQGLALPASNLFSAFVVAMLVTDLGARFAVAALAVPLMILPFALVCREPVAPVQASRPKAQLSLAALLDHDFLIAFVSRMLVQVTITLNVIYLLFYVQGSIDFGGRPAPGSPETILGWLMASATVASLVAGLAGGLLSDRLGRRRLLVTAGALVMALGAALMALAPQWPTPILAQIVFGAGLGLFSTVDIALVAEVLPDPAATGRDLGLMNIAITVPQVIAPLIGLVVLTVLGRDLAWVFAVSTAFAAAGGLVVLRIRRVA